MNAQLLQYEVEQFLFHESSLLDGWQLREWTALFSADGSYLVAPTDVADADPARVLFLVNDDHFRLSQRAERLLNKLAHAESPHSKTQHSVSNVRVRPQDDGTLRVECHLVVYKSRRDVNDVFPAKSRYDLERDSSGSFRIRTKRVELSIGSLRPHGHVSIIL